MSHWVKEIRISLANFRRDTPYPVDEIRVHPLIMMELLRTNPGGANPIEPTHEGYTFDGVKLVQDSKEGTFSIRRGRAFS